MAKPASISIRATLAPYERRLVAERKSVKTIEGYVGYIRRFADDCDKMNGGRAFLVYNITSEHVTDTFARYENAAQHNYCLASLRSWFRYCVRNGYITHVAVERCLDGFTHVKDIRRPKLYIPASRFGEMLGIAGERHPRDRMVVALVLFTLSRQSEIAPMRLEDVDRLKGNVRIFRRKTSRYTDCGISLDLDRELGTYLAFYAGEFGYADADALLVAHPEWYLIPRLKPYGSHVKKMLPEECITSGLEHIMKNVLGEMDGLESQHGRAVRFLGEGMHTGRRSGARALFLHLLDTEGRDMALRTVQTMLDHDTPKQTLRYIGYDEERVRVNDWVRGHSMYGFTPGQEADGGATVISFPPRQARKAAASVRA